MDSNEEFDERDLLVDIYSLNEKETDAVRLDASTIKQLYEDTDYKLDDIRKNKLVKPVALDSFPREIKMIENTKKRKEFFIQIVLPLILQENNNIRLDRKSKDYYVSICIAKKFRRKGIGLKALSLIEKKINNSKIITALVNKKNLNSIEMFSKHGYTVHSKKKNYLIMTKKLNKVKIIDQIEMIRRKNNGNWMDLLRLAYKNSPRESTMIMAKIYRDDSRISKLVKKLIK